MIRRRALMLVVVVAGTAGQPMTGAVAHGGHVARTAAAVLDVHVSGARGRLLQVGGPVRPDGSTPRQPVGGFLRVARHHHVVEWVTVASNGHFRLTLRPGHYRLTGYMKRHQSDSSCVTEHPTVVQPGHMTRVSVICPVP